MHIELVQYTISEAVCVLSPVSMLSFTMHSPASRAASQGRSKPSAGITIQSPGTSSSELTHSSSGKTNKHVKVTLKTLCLFLAFDEHLYLPCLYAQSRSLSTAPCGGEWCFAAQTYKHLLTISIHDTTKEL